MAEGFLCTKHSNDLTVRETVSVTRVSYERRVVTHPSMTSGTVPVSFAVSTDTELTMSQ